MANAIVTVKIMPVSPEVDLKAVEVIAKEKIAAFAGEGETRTSIEPVAFGLNSLSITFVMDESIGSPDIVADQIAELEDVNSAEISDVRRAVG
ncbi:MAG: elongation factor 1-beta [archaeon]